MRCPYCGYSDSKVTDSRMVIEAIRRRRQCARCEARFTTYERVLATSLLVVKRDGRREEFNRDKIMTGIANACAKRPIAFKDIETLVQETESELQLLGQAEVASSLLGEMIMHRLRRLDRVAYVRFASVYRDFKDLESFEKVVKDLREGTEQLSLIEGASSPAIAGMRRGRRKGWVPRASRTLADQGRLGGVQHG